MSESLLGDYLLDNNIGTPLHMVQSSNVVDDLVKAVEMKLTPLAKKDISVDVTSMRRMFNIWVYKLLHNLDDEHKELLKFFDLPEHPQTDEDFMKLINSLKIIEHCTSSLEYTNVCLLGVSMLLMWFLRASGDFIGQHIIGIDSMTAQEQEDYKNAHNAKLDCYVDMFLSEKYVKRVLHAYLSHKVKVSYESLITQKDFKVPSTHPLFIVFADVIGVITSFGRDLYMDPAVRGLLKRKHSEINK
jgi:hypothetical protein